MRNAYYLQRRGFTHVSVLEIPETIARFAKLYSGFAKRGGRILKKIPDRPAFDVVICTFVLETICPASSRHRLLRAAVTALRSGGKFVLSVRGQDDIKATCLTACKLERRGHVTSLGTFIRELTVSDVKSMLTKEGLTITIARNRVENPRIINVIGTKL